MLLNSFPFFKAIQKDYHAHSLHLKHNKMLIPLILRFTDKTGRTFSGFLRVEGGWSRIFFIAINGGSLKNGGSVSIISITITPKDQMSALKNIVKVNYKSRKAWQMLDLGS